MNNWRE